MSILKDKDVKIMTIAESLKKIRKQYKLKQEDVSKLIGVSRSGYAYYETGKTLPSIEVLEKLSAVYKTSIDVIIGNQVNFNGGMSDGSSVAEGKKDPLMFMQKDEQTLVMVYRLLSEKGKEEFMKMAEQMLENNNAQNK